VAKVEPTSLHPGEDPREIVEHNAQKAADRLGLDSEMRPQLNMPLREIRVEVPVRMDGGSLGREAATGRGVFVITEALIGELGLPVAGAGRSRSAQEFTGT